MQKHKFENQNGGDEAAWFFCTAGVVYMSNLNP